MPTIEEIKKFNSQLLDIVNKGTTEEFKGEALKELKDRNSQGM